MSLHNEQSGKRKLRVYVNCNYDTAKNLVYNSATSQCEQCATGCLSCTSSGCDQCDTANGYTGNGTCTLPSTDGGSSTAEEGVSLSGGQIAGIAVGGTAGVAILGVLGKDGLIQFTKECLQEQQAQQGQQGLSLWKWSKDQR